MATAEASSYTYFKDFYEQISADSNGKKSDFVFFFYLKEQMKSKHPTNLIIVSEWWSLHPKSDSQHFVKGFLFVSPQKRDRFILDDTVGDLQPLSCRSSD